MTTPDIPASRQDDGPEGSASPAFDRSAAEQPIPEQTAAELRAAVKGMIATGDRFRSARIWTKARAAYEEALALDPTMAHIWVQLGHARKESGDFHAAEMAYREALKLTPEDADGYLQLGHLHKIQEQLSKALEAYQHAQEIDPSLEDAQIEIALLLERIEQQRQSGQPQIDTRGRQPALARYPRQAAPSDGKTLHVAFDVSDLMHYFRNARLPTGIQRVQMEVIRTAIETAAPGISYSIVCFTRETDFWVEVPQMLFYRLCRQAVISGDHQAPEWLALLSQLDSVLMSRRYYSFAQGTVLLNLGTSWWLQNYFLNVRLAKSLFGIKYVPFVHDFIPVMAPEHCVSQLRQDFITWAIGAFDHADFFLVNSKATLADLQTVGAKLGYAPRDAAVIPLDADFRKTLSDEAILDEIGDPVEYLHTLDLEPGRYVLFVSTIESRKNHIAAFSVWLKLIKKHGMKNVPKLVCVGNKGWLNDATYARLNASDLLQEQVLMLSKISDAALALLYQNSICTLYPSSYEGWGLPVTEALCYGKVPIVSNVSSLPEAGGPFAEYFDVESEKDMMEAVERIIHDDKYRQRREQKIQAEFHARSWNDISTQIIDQLSNWKKIHANDPAPVLPPGMHGIWPLEAEMGTLHTLASNTSNILWAGLKSGEIYRNGPGWWWPEHWGCWIKGTGPSSVAFVLKNVPDENVVVYVCLRGAQGRTSVGTIKSEGARTVSATMHSEQDKVVALTLPARPDKDRLVVLSVSSDVAADFRESTGGADFRVCGVGVRWIYACRDSDVLARMKMLEAMSLGDFARLQREQPDSDFFLHT